MNGWMIVGQRRGEMKKGRKEGRKDVNTSVFSS